MALKSRPVALGGFTLISISLPITGIAVQVPTLHCTVFHIVKQREVETRETEDWRRRGSVLVLCPSPPPLSEAEVTKIPISTMNFRTNIVMSCCKTYCLSIKLIKY